jgi:hypothetical protein
VNREVGLVTRRLQDLVVQRYEARRTDERSPAETADRRRRKPREVPMPRAVDRPSVVRPFIPAVQRHRQAMDSESTRFAAAR